MNRTIIFLILLTTLAAAFTVAAQDEAPDRHHTRSMLTIDAGYASIHDSYLTPITYGGLDLGLAYVASRVCKQGLWQWQLQVGADYNYVENPAKNNDLHKVMGDLSFSMQRRWAGAVAGKVNLSVGPMAQLRAGIVYNAVNSNNPVTVRAHCNVGAAAEALYPTRLGRKPIALRYQVQLPVVGVFFAPQYDESYYEIYLGNHRHLAHLGWWGNRLDMTHYLGAEVQLGKTMLGIGYRARLERWSVNNLHVHDASHAVVLSIGL